MQNSLQYIQRQKMMPQTAQSLQLLSVPLFALTPFLEKVITGNPLLEMCYSEELVPFFGCDGLADSDSVGDTEWEYAASSPCGIREEILGCTDETLHSALLMQANLYPGLTDEQRQICVYLISNINQDGYLEETTAHAAELFRVTQETIERVLQIIQTFSPVGVGARTPQECLLLQLDASAPDYDLARRLIQNDLEMLAGRHINFLAKKYTVSRRRVEAVLELLLRLEPHPGVAYAGNGSFPYIVADAVVRNTPQGLSLTVRGGRETLFAYNENYLSGVQDPLAAAFLKEKRREASLLIKSVDMRYHAIFALMEYLVAEQRAFFQFGPGHLRPITMKQAADAVGMHPSTISRCANSKYVETPWGTIPIRELFSCTLPESSCSQESAIRMVALAIAAESKQSPKSDQDIAEELARQGITISRRTVAKYRAQLGIRCQFERRRYQPAAGAGRIRPGRTMPD